MSAEEETKDEMPIFVSPIATPLAGKKLTKKCLKLVKKGALTFFFWSFFFSVVCC
jgi:hypothetical protein